MKRVKLWDKEFEVSYPNEQIVAAVKEMAVKMREDLEGKEAIFLCVLNGCFMFAADLLKEVELTDAEVSFVKLASYEGTQTTENIKQLIGLKEDLKDRTVVIVEDIVDSGFTIANLIDQVTERGAADIRVATLLFKPKALKKDVTVDYVGLEIPNDFIVGYGLDYDGRGRNLKDIYTLVP
ncbi:hypoxanthine phosphoribosyltransferase [Halosquirtibacter xylanolyticus]|uniref:hypoxanthine phosphoribosyltransferase n=1 Tax=Halosquirtibacter xylanolyticus TaxID=3374599 RepID=UPI00374A89C6|nr:hypoxanthine phosphoribosyltransferase [Prolixibacteraceae bacterium]